MEITRDVTGVPQKIVMQKPWNGHTHTRQGGFLRLVLPMLAKRYWGAVIMPNTTPPMTTCGMLNGYRRENRQALHDHFGHWNFAFEPAMSFYLTDALDWRELEQWAKQGSRILLKYYPHGLTTNSESGVTDPAALWTKGSNPWLAIRMVADCGGSLMLHAADGVDKEGRELDPYEQERYFLLETLPRIYDAHNVDISIEHLSTTWGCEIMRGNENFGCTITAHHLLLDRRDVYRGGMHPHNHCWPVIQTDEHRQELRKLVSEGNPFVFLGDDSAPHPVGRKECVCAAGGLFTAPASIELYAEAFEDIGCLDKLEEFATNSGPAFHGIKTPSNVGTITLVREPWMMEPYFESCEKPVGMTYHDWLMSSCIRPFRAGEEIRWKLVQD